VILFALREGWRSFRSLGLLGLLTLAVLTMTLALTGLVGSGYLLLHDWSRGLLGRFEVEAFFHTEVDSAAIAEVGQAALQHPYIRSATYISKDQAARRFAADFGSNVFEVLGTNPLPASLIVSLREDADPRTAWKSASTFLESSPGVERVIYDGELLAQLDSFNRRAGRVVTMVVGAALLLSVTLSVMTVTSAIRARSEFLRVVLLSGGTPWLARGPFAALGAYYGLLSGIAAGLSLQGLLWFIRLSFAIPMVSGWKSTTALAAAGGAIGTIAAATAAGRAIREV